MCLYYKLLYSDCIDLRNNYPYPEELALRPNLIRQKFVFLSEIVGIVPSSRCYLAKNLILNSF